MIVSLFDAWTARPTGVVGSTAILPGWVGVAAAEEMHRRLDLPILVDNDAAFFCTNDAVSRGLAAVADAERRLGDLAHPEEFFVKFTLRDLVIDLVFDAVNLEHTFIGFCVLRDYTVVRSRIGRRRGPARWTLWLLLTTAGRRRWWILERVVCF